MRTGGTFARGLEAPPFSKEIADGDLWLPSSKAGVVDELCEAVSEHVQQPGALHIDEGSESRRQASD